MYKQTFALFIGFIMSLWCPAQFCGLSGPAVCSTIPFIDTTGALPFMNANNDIPCVIRGNSYNASIQLKKADASFTFGGQTVNVQSIKIDSISNLPCGLCWATDKPNNTLVNIDSLCINVKGTSNDAPGQYALRMYCTANIGVPVQATSEQFGFKLIVRVVQDSTDCLPIDTSLVSNTACLPSSLNSFQDEYVSVYRMGHLLQIEAIHENFNASVYDLSGRLVLSQQSNSKTITIDLTPHRGFVLLHLSSSTFSDTHKFYID